MQDTLGERSSLFRIAEPVDRFAESLLDTALVLAAVATITMSLLELFKVLVRARPLYHRWAVSRWTGSPAVFDELLALTVGDAAVGNALFDQPTDKMMGQIQSAANVALEYPNHFPNLYSSLTTVRAIDGEQISPGDRPGADDQKLWRKFATQLEEQTEAASRSMTEGGSVVVAEADEATLRAAGRARGRLDHFVARRLDALQTRTEYRWARGNQFVAVLSASIFLAFLLYPVMGFAPAWFVASSFGGMMAPLAKDVVTALTGLRARRTP